ncbi:MAG: hypothetical protein HPY45_05895 [Anaerolineae bacterium]|nr:hypothetical protein [Anaerolineae bacterium]
MIILGITDNHTSSACLLKDGHILGMVSEERFNRIKGWMGFPERSVRWLLESNGLSGAEVDFVAINRLGGLPVGDIEKADQSLLRKGIKAVCRIAPDGFLGSNFVKDVYLRYAVATADFGGVRNSLAELGIDSSKLRRVEHHSAHAATAYYLANFYDPEETVLIFTMDGSGDALCATVSLGQQGCIRRIHAISTYHSLGEMYTRATQYLGMKPIEHEYKVMGLAPYAPEALAEKAYQIFKEFFVLSPDGLSFQNRSHRVFDDLIHLYMERLKGMRFDAVAAAVQRVLEEVVVAYVRNWIRKTGIRKIALAGGSFMNVKLNMLISQLPEVENLFIMPSCSDESTCLGAALKVYADECRALGKQLQVEALMHLYYGPEYGERELLSALEKHAGEVCWKKSAKITDEVADVLVKNGIVARLAGRMEFGARALGNRSILANPSEMRNVSNINRAIKMRDYWMPFAPVILEERQHDYVINPRSWPAKYMINAFESTPLAQKELICGLHPADLTCRPQFVTREDNEGYYDIVKKFEAKTGIGGLLNTSFNLHGEPIVCTPEDGISTLLRSKIDYLAVSDYLVWRKDMPAPEEFVR